MTEIRDRLYHFRYQGRSSAVLPPPLVVDHPFAMRGASGLFNGADNEAVVMALSTFARNALVLLAGATLPVLSLLSVHYEPILDEDDNPEVGKDGYMLYRRVHGMELSAPLLLPAGEHLLRLDGDLQQGSQFDLTLFGTEEFE